MSKDYARKMARAGMGFFKRVWERVKDWGRAIADFVKEHWKICSAVAGVAIVGGGTAAYVHHSSKRRR